MASPTFKDSAEATFSRNVEDFVSAVRSGSDRRSRTTQIVQSISRIALAFALTFSVADWFSAIRSPLWLDETNSYWSISQGFSKIWAHQGLSFPAYSYILWATKSLFGSSEVALRMPSLFAMLLAVYVLYLTARRFFESDVAGIVAVIFCIHPFVSFAAIDARPYAFGTLAVNCSILCLLRWMETNNTSRAVIFGISVALVFYFHYLFSVILGALGLIFFSFKRKEWKRYAPKSRLAIVPFSVMMLPVIPRLLWMVHTRQSHVYLGRPGFRALLVTVAPGNIALVFAGAVFIAVITRKLAAPEQERRETISSCLLLALVPLLSLYSISSYTPLHIFAERYRLVALPGVALCWGLLVSRLNSTLIRTLFCLALIAFTFNEFPGSTPRRHGYSWKDALEVADDRATTTRAPLLICSGLIESDFVPMPTKDIEQSALFAPLSYYNVHAPVIPLPFNLNQEAKSQVETFLRTAIPNREQFFVLGHGESQETTKWIASRTMAAYQSTDVGTYDGVTVTQFVPR